MSSRRVIVVVLFPLLAAACSPLTRPSETSTPEAQSTAGLPQVLAKIPVSFVENRGQVPSRDVAHYVNTPSASIGFTSKGLRFFLTDARGTNQRWGLALDFVGGRARPIGQELREGVVSYFKGDPRDWKTGIPTHGRLVYRDLWPNIDLVYRGEGPRLKYELLVHPGGDPNDIRFRWRGASAVSIDHEGSLRVTTPAGAITDGAPISFQGKQRVRTSYHRHGTTYGFRLNRYDRSRTLVIDPVLVPYTGYIGGSSSDQSFGIAVDASGAAYITGEVNSDATTFPAAVGPDLTYNGGEDAFVVKVNPSGTALAYAGYIGGSGSEVGYDIAVDASGAAYVTGPTNSDPVTFPETVGPSLVKGMGSDAFVAKVNPSGTALSYAGYIGGAGIDVTYGIAVDAAGAAYVAGDTDSDASTFPDTVGPDLTHNGGFDGFVAKVNPSGTALSYAGYLGGAGNEVSQGIDIDAAGAAYITGYTDSDAATFPVTVGPSLTKGFDVDAFVAKVNPSGTTLSYAGYIGGNAQDFGQGIAVDSAGAAYVTGSTLSAAGTFPEVVGPDVTRNGGLSEAFVAKVAPSGTAFVYAGYIGGSGEEGGEGIDVDASGAAYVIGGTNSDAASFPATVGPDVSYNGSGDAFVAKVSASGTTLSYAGYLGGTGGDRGLAIAVDGAGAAYVTGDTSSDEASFPVTVGPDLTYNGGLVDAYVAKVTDNLCLGKAVTIQGTADADTLVGSSGSDVILGLGGNDTIAGGGGNDTICAGDGNDVLVGGGGDDALDGEEGSDTASFVGFTAVTADLATGTASGASTDSLAGIENLAGSSGKDILRGNDGPNRLQGGAGGDRLSGRKGADRLAGQAGADNLLGGRGNDRLSGGRGRDRLSGGRGRDRCAGGKGDDTATGCERVSGV